MLLSELAPTTPSAQTWAAIATAVAGAVAVFVKKRYNRTRNSRQPATPKPDLITRTELHQSLDSVVNKVEANHKDLLTVLANQGAIIEHRLDRLDSIVARLDERTK